LSTAITIHSKPPGFIQEKNTVLPYSSIEIMNFTSNGNEPNRHSPNQNNTSKPQITKYLCYNYSDKERWEWL